MLQKQPSAASFHPFHKAAIHNICCVHQPPALKPLILNLLNKPKEWEPCEVFVLQDPHPKRNTQFHMGRGLWLAPQGIHWPPDAPELQPTNPSEASR